MNEYQKLQSLQEQYNVAIQCTCVCHHLEGAVAHDTACCTSSTQNLARLKEEIRKQQSHIRGLENG